MARVRVRLAETEEQALQASAILREHVKMVGFVTRGAVLKKWKDGELGVALDGDAVVGCVCFHVRRDRVATIYEIAVSGQARPRGVGAAMVAWLAKHLARKAIAIKLKCTSDNELANKFYARVGFAHCGEVKGRKRSLILWRMELGGFLKKAPR